jgi:hypothetical protein
MPPPPFFLTLCRHAWHVGGTPRAANLTGQSHAALLVHQAPANPVITCDTLLHPDTDLVYEIYDERPDLPLDEGSNVAASSEFMEDANFVLSASEELFYASPYHNSFLNNVNACNGAPVTPQDSTVLNGPGEAPAAALSQTQPTGPTQPTIANPSQPSIQSPLTCPHGCRGSFNRPGEYRRHMGKHRGHTLMCPQSGCGKTFYRKDKVTDHLRQFHKITLPRRAY